MVLTRDDLVGGRDDRARDALVEVAELVVHDRGGALDAGERHDLRGLEAGSGDREVLDGALSLRAVQRGGRNAHLAHRVVLDAELFVGHGGVLPFRLADSVCGGV